MIYLLPQFGLGNIIQTIPAFRWLQAQHGKDHVAIACPHDKREFIGAVFDGEKIEDADAVAVKARRTIIRSANPDDFKFGGKMSEVVRNLEKAGCPPALQRQYRQPTGLPCQDLDIPVDIVIADGYNKRRGQTGWQAKSYPHWPRLVAMLKADGYSVASAGTPDEYVEGTIDLTGLTLPETFALVKGVRLVVSNDTGLYHAAAALGTRCVAIFTMTDTTKNYDPIFHNSVEIVQEGLPCQPCQLKTPRMYWIHNKRECAWACRNIGPATILETIRRNLT